MFGAELTRFRWAGAPSYTKITSFSRSRFVLVCAKKLSERAAFFPPTASEENTSPSIGGIALFTVKFRPHRTDVVAAFVDKHAVAHYGMVPKPSGVIDSLVHHIKPVSVSREGPYKFHSDEHPV